MAKPRASARRELSVEARLRREIKTNLHRAGRSEFSGDLRPGIAMARARRARIRLNKLKGIKFGEKDR